MTKQQLDRIIEQVASQNRVTPQEVRREMQKVMESAMASTDPVVQAQWSKIPRKGETVTLEELIEYVAMETIRRS